MSDNLKRRLTFGPIMLAALGLILWGDWWIERVAEVRGVGLLVLLGLILPMAVFELTKLFAAEKVTPFRMVAGVGSALLILHAFATQFDAFKPIAASVLAFIIVGVMLFAALRRAVMREVAEAIVAMAGTLLATMYLGGLAWFLMALRVKTGETWGFEGGTLHVVMILLCVKFTDIGAFFTGTAIGKHKLIPWLSPGKTWEGLAGGLVFAGLVGLAFAPWLVLLAWWEGAIFGMVIGLTGQFGDLLESLMKRDAGVKDSGQSIPGFGGVLDVIDSPLVAAPVAYLLFSLF